MAFISLSSCSRAPLDSLCPSIDVGDLVVTELRGPQSAVDTFGQWIEIASRRPQDLPVRGLIVRLSKLDGSSPAEFAVRDTNLVLIGGGYMVLGRQPQSPLPAHVHYGYRGDYDKDLLSEGIVEIDACGKLIDRVVYRALPTQGTYSLSGKNPPSATDNDNAAAWCTDSSPADPVGTPDGGSATLGLPGTPGARNRPCP